MSNTLLKVSGLKVAYGGIQAVKGVDLEVRAGEPLELPDRHEADRATGFEETEPT